MPAGFRNTIAEIVNPEDEPYTPSPLPTDMLSSPAYLNMNSYYIIDSINDTPSSGHDSPSPEPTDPEPLPSGHVNGGNGDNPRPPTRDISRSSSNSRDILMDSIEEDEGSGSESGMNGGESSGQDSDEGNNLPVYIPFPCAPDCDCREQIRQLQVEIDGLKLEFRDIRTALHDLRLAHPPVDRVENMFGSIFGDGREDLGAAVDFLEEFDYGQRNCTVRD